MYNNWTYFIQRLTWFKEIYGHCNVPNIFPGDQLLALRARIIRTKKMLGSLTEAQFIELNELGFTWATNNKRWEQNLFYLKEFYREHGHFEVSGKQYDKLRVWLYSLKKQYQAEILSEERIKALKMLGFPINNWGKSQLKTKSSKKRLQSI